ncbi:MAG: M56 family metallopeptidase [Balneolaceae bacterium]|nr:M56 family metallopeptidase [Balneolaceae bacterium]
MISYLIYSTICLGLVLIFYHAFLSKEKIYQINRWYLIIGLLFSLTAPFIPIGVVDSLSIFGNVPEFQVSQLIESETGNVNNKSIQELPVSATEESNGEEETISGVGWMHNLFFYIYSVVTVLLFARIIVHLFQIHRRAKRNPAIFFRGSKVVLLNQDITPHTFWKTIFVNKEQYENGEIREEVLIHELTHARQYHSLDILLVEFLKSIWWFNPFLYFYKTAIQLNHEFIADDIVLSRGANIADYQALLLQVGKTKSFHYLNTCLDFKLTKKRFRMMTRKTSTFRSSLKAFAIIPFFLALALTFGCESASIEKDMQGEITSIEIVDSETINLNGNRVSASEFKSQFSDLPIDTDQTIIDFKVHEGASFELVTEIEKVLREKGTLRVNYATIQSKSNKGEGVQVTGLDKRNVFPILISKDGLLLANEEPASISEINSLVTEFITNKEKSDDLSESPQEAIITIKTAENTPQDIYNSALEEIMNAYHEVRNQASMELYDRPFKSLEEGSKEKKKIESMYPKKISIKGPSSS